MNRIVAIPAVSLLLIGCGYWQEKPRTTSAWTPTLHVVPTPAAAPVAADRPPSGASLEERLRKLKALYEEGLITSDEMKRRRAEILKDL